MNGEIPVGEVTRLHHQAMGFYDLALERGRAGDLERQSQFLSDAYESENQAAEILAEHHDFEPSRSVLHRSAATLALDCGRYRDGLRLIETALEGQPPAEIVDELNDLRTQVSAEATRRSRTTTVQVDPGSASAETLTEFLLAVTGYANTASRADICFDWLSR